VDYLPYILLAVVGFVVAMQLRLYFSAKRAQGKPAPDFVDLLNDNQREMPVLLFYFHSEYCGPCRRMTPAVEQLATQTGAVIVVDVGHNPEPALRFGVRVTPTMMRVSNGIIEKVVVGEVGDEKLKQLLVS